MPTITETTDATNTTATAYTMSVGDVFFGSITAADRDWVAITLEAGQTYTFGLVGVGALEDSLNDPYLHFYDSTGTLLSNNTVGHPDNPDDRGPGLTSQLTYTASTTGTYYLEARDYNNARDGDYGLSVTAGSIASYGVIMGASVLTRQESAWTSSAGTGVTVTWGIRDTGPAADADGNTVTFEGLSAAQIAATEMAMSAFEDISGLSFTYVNSGGTTDDATMLFGAYTSTTDGSGAYAYLPGSTASGDNPGDVWLNNDSVSTSTLPTGSYSYFVLLHEIGHAVGLSHPGDYNASAGSSITYAEHAQFREDSRQYTVMSYFDESNTTADFSSRPDTLLLYDIYALHQLYGADMSFHDGDSVYGFNSNLGGVYDFTTNTTPFLSIWDGGGTDTLDGSGFSQDATIRLTEGSFSGLGGYETVSIAIGAVIENAIGGSGDDLIEGNATSNELNGNAGADTLEGAAGHDTLFGGAGNDNLIGGTGGDSLMGEDGNDTLEGESSTDILRGGDGNDSLIGGTGTDTLYGGDGDDRMFGNTSLDTLYGGNGNDFISGGDGVDWVDGGAGNDTIHGRSGWDTLFGGAGNDTLYGSQGDDQLNGGDGDDWLSAGSAWDTLFGNDGNDTLYGNFGSDVQSGGAGNDALYGGTGDDTLRGGDGNDTLQGNQGVDQLEGGAGDDLLRGGTQRDTFIFDTGHDRDEINDFEHAGDILRLSTDLTGGLTDAAQILSTYASTSSGSVVFDFGGGDIITLSNLSSLDNLTDNIDTY